MTDQRVSVTIARRSVKVPVCEDPDTTREIAQRLTARLDAIEREREIEIVDSHLSALYLAYELAVQLHDLKRRHGEETDQVIVALEQAATRLEQLLDEAE